MFIKIKASEFVKRPIFLYRNCNKNKPKALFTGGIHHYENTIAHLYEFMDKPPSITREFDLYIIPEINPGNFLGLNRTFDVNDVPHEYRFLRDINPVSLAVDFHADFEGDRFYVYERAKQDSLCPLLFAKLGRNVPLLGKKAFEPEDLGEKTLEEFNFDLGSDYSLTTETHNRLLLPNEQIEFNKRLAKLLLETYFETHKGWVYEFH